MLFTTAEGVSTFGSRNLHRQKLGAARKLPRCILIVGKRRLNYPAWVMRVSALVTLPAEKGNRMSKKLCACGCGYAVSASHVLYKSGHRFSRGKADVPPNPSGLCLCGCGETTPIANSTIRQESRLHGHHTRFMPGHNHAFIRSLPGKNPAGLCMCGCGEKTPLARQTDKSTGSVRGKPLMFIHNHHARGERNCNYKTPEEKLISQAEQRVRYAVYKKRRLLASKYGLTLERFNEMLDSQNNLCALCNEPFASEGKSYPAVDHDHRCCPSDVTCGKCIRGLIHSRCNTGLGYFKDSPELLRLAADYLESGLAQ